MDNRQYILHSKRGPEIILLRHELLTFKEILGIKMNAIRVHIHRNHHNLCGTGLYLRERKQNGYINDKKCTTESGLPPSTEKP